MIPRSCSLLNCSYSTVRNIAGMSSFSFTIRSTSAGIASRPLAARSWKVYQRLIYIAHSHFQSLRLENPEGVSGNRHLEGSAIVPAKVAAPAEDTGPAGLSPG